LKFRVGLVSRFKGTESIVQDTVQGTGLIKPFAC